MSFGAATLCAARLCVLAALIIFAATLQALAHAALISSQPADRAVLASSPDRFILIFNEPVTPLRLQLIDNRGEAMPLTNVVQHNMSLILRAPVPLGQGTHALSWRVVSADGHPVAGTLVFSVGQPDTTTPILDNGDAKLRTAVWLVRAAIFAALFFGNGGAFFANWIGRPLPGRAANAIAALCAVGFVLLPVSIGLQGLDALGLPLSAFFTLEPWNAGFATTYGKTALIAQAALLLALIALLARGALARVASLTALAGVGFALAASGHAAAAAPQALMRPAVWLHAVAVTLWIGSLYPLRTLLRAGPDPALPRFSRAIPWVIVALLVSGVTLAVVQLARVDALWTTNYGWILSIKLVLVALFLALAAANRFWLTAQVENGDPVARTQLRYSMALEITLAVLIFALVAGWRFTPPPRSIPQEPQAEFVHFHANHVMADVTLTPGRAGRSTGELMMRDERYQPVTPKEVTLIFSQLASGIEPMRREAVSLGNARWRIDDVVLPRPGRWRLRIDVLVNDFEKVSLEDDIRIRP